MNRNLQDNQSKNQNIPKKTADTAQKKDTKKPFSWLIALDVLIILGILLVGYFGFLKPSAEDDRAAASASTDTAYHISGSSADASEKAPVESVSGNSAYVSADSSDDSADMVSWNGQKYQYNRNLETVLFLGIDTEDLDETEDTSGKVVGQSDTIVLFICNTSDGSFRILPINRDTMTDVTSFGMDGTAEQTSVRHLCTQYAYGGGGERSADLTCKAVSKFLYGVPIDHYCAIDMTAIPEINDKVGGVTVEALETVSSSIQKGMTVTLRGDDAETYVRYRITDESGGNEMRMERQKQYFSAFLNQLKETMKQDIAVPMTIYSSLRGNMVTDLSGGDFTNLASDYGNGGVSDSDYLIVPGKVVHNDETRHDEFYADDAALQQLVIETFYTPVQ